MFFNMVNALNGGWRTKAILGFFVLASVLRLKDWWLGSSSETALQKFDYDAFSTPKVKVKLDSSVCRALCPTQLGVFELTDDVVSILDFLGVPSDSMDCGSFLAAAVDGENKALLRGPSRHPQKASKYWTIVDAVRMFLCVPDGSSAKGVKHLETFESVFDTLRVAQKRLDAFRENKVEDSNMYRRLINERNDASKKIESLIHGACKRYKDSR